MNGPPIPGIDHNGGPPLDDDDPAPAASGQCKHCLHWKPPSRADERAYESFRLGLSRRRVRRPSGACDRVRTQPGKPVAFSATSAEFGCLNFTAKPDTPRPTGGGFVTVYEDGQVVWQGNEAMAPARFRTPEPGSSS